MKPLYLAGPTAVGKSAAAMELAERLNAEIVSVDSMQVYRGLNIGTAKPSRREQERIRHHLIDVVGLEDAFDAAKFVELAELAVKEAKGRGCNTIFCGGTGLYFKAWLAGLGEAPTSDESLREELESIDVAVLLEELKEKDRQTFERIDRENPRRIVRAIEVIRLTGKPFSEQRADWGEIGDAKVICLIRESTDLRERINQRVDQMFGQGLVGEVEALLKNGLAENRTAMQAIGYRQVVEHLRGERSLDETIELIKTKTWQFARRQSTWFRNQLPSVWVEATTDEPIESLVDRAYEACRASIKD